MEMIIPLLVVLFVSIGFLLSGASLMTGYYAEPSGYGFYHIWTANLHMAIALTLLGSTAMVFMVRKIEKRLF